MAFTALRNEAPDRILLGEIVFCSLGDGGGRRKPDALPFKASFDGPGQDAGPFLLQFFCEARVPFCGRNRHGEGHQVEPSPNCLIDIPKARPVVSGNNELEGRLVGEEVLAHEPGIIGSPPVKALILDSAQ